MKRLDDREKDATRYGVPEEEEMEEGRKPIIIRDFVRPDVECWAQEAQKHWDSKQPIQAFICAWIAFNHCYGLFWTNLRRQKSRRGKKTSFPCLFGHDYCEDLTGYMPDHVQIATFINQGKENPGFALFWESFKARQGVSSVQKIGLPVLHLETNTPVPDSTPLKRRLIELDKTRLFQVLVTIRNNLFHGGKRFTRDRDVEVCTCAAEFMVPFVTELIENIEA